MLRRVAMAGGGWVELGADGAPRAVLCDPARRGELEGGALLERAEAAVGRWLCWDGRWRALRPDDPAEAAVAWVGAAGGDLATPAAAARAGEVMRRLVALDPTQPTHRAVFTPDGGAPPRTWLLLVEEAADQPGVAYAWDHAEWVSTASRYEDGGVWRRVNPYWLRAGQTTPDAAPGVLVVEPLAGAAAAAGWDAPGPRTSRVAAGGCA